MTTVFHDYRVSGTARVSAPDSTATNEILDLHMRAGYRVVRCDYKIDLSGLWIEYDISFARVTSPVPA